MELPENKYDHAVTIGVFMYIPENDGFSNIFKTIKPGGLFYFEDYYFVRDRSTFTEEDNVYVNGRGMIGVRTKE